MAEWGGFNSFFANNNAGQSFLKGMEQGQARRKLAAQKNALSQYAMNPNDPNAVNALAQVNPEMAIKARQQQAETAQRQQKAQQEGLEAQRDNIVRGAQIIREINPVDQSSWTQARETARRIGIDVSKVPEVWNEQTAQYAKQMVFTANTFEPAKAESSEFQLVTPQPGGAVVRVNKRTGASEVLFAPNDGSQQMGAPAEPGQPAPPGVTFTPIQGGQSSSTTGTFLDPLAPR